MKVYDIYNALNEIAPFSGACSWDNSGLITGDMSDKVERVYVTLDADMHALKGAIANDCTLVVSHHPLVFDALRTVTPDDTIYHYIKNSVSVISAHTCLDAADGGINDIFAQLVGINYPEKLVLDGVALGRYGNADVTDDFIENLKQKFNTKRLDCVITRPIKKIAVISGSGGSVLSEIKALGCDTLITGEAKHDHFVYAADHGLNLIALGHFETENIIVKPLCDKLLSLVCGVEFIPSDRTAFIERR